MKSRRQQVNNMRLCCPFRRFFNCIHLFVVVLICIPQNSSGQLEEVPTPVGKCDAGRMTVSLPTHAIPFKGIIHARGFRSNPNCFANSSSNSFAPPSLNLNLLSQPGDEDYCGVISLKDGREKAVSIAIRAHSSLELQEDKYFLLTCSNIKTATKGSRTSKALRDKQQDGLIFYDLEAGHTTRPVAILGKSYYFGPKEDNHIIGSCVAFGSIPDPNSVVELLDNKGCPSDAAIVNSVEFTNREESTEPDAEVITKSPGGGRIMKVKIKSMFRFPNKDFKKTEEENKKDAKGRKSSDDDDKWLDNRVTVQCTSVPCGGKCPAPCSREAGNLLSESSSATSLVTASVNVLNPGMECDHEIQHELTRDWLIALLICLGILLLVMFCVNLFLCSSMACTCYKQEIIDTSSLSDTGDSHIPVNAYDYDPYKVHQNSHHVPDHPLYASLQRKGAHSMIEPSSTRHPHLGSPHRGYDVQRETYSLGGTEGRTRSRHSYY